MRKELVDEVIALGGDPTDQVWHWLLLHGPHVPTFTWGQSRSEPAGCVGVEHLQKIVGEMSETDSTFLERARAVISKAMSSGNPSIVRRGIQVASVIGVQNELAAIATLKAHPDPVVSADARAAEFHLKRRMRGIAY